jgi:DNA-binding NarL/FixJ family response regulator
MLTVREREIVTLVSLGLSNKEVARHLELSEGTVKIHLHRIFKKAGVANRTALAGWHSRSSQPNLTPPLVGSIH